MIEAKPHPGLFSSVHILEAWREGASLARGDRLFLALSSVMQEALVCKNSLTRHLEALSGSPLRVRLERQTLCRAWQDDSPFWSELHRLPTGDDILVRDAWLSVDRQELILAHSEMPLGGVAPEIRAAVDRGEEPLGIVFQEREGEVSRQHLELARMCVPEVARRLGLASAEVFWCRRSLFLTGFTVRARILELFLPFPPFL
ncbi:MAG: chorismate lyase [Magnetococcales bacterium]|nr:chorismate lyase [Magnetococcales bacterium]